MARSDIVLVEENEKGTIIIGKVGDPPKLLDHVPAKVYTVSFDPEQGIIRLVPFLDKFSLPEKVYGDHEKVVSLIFNDYKSLKEPSLGAFFYGHKGAGKSLAAEDISNRAIKMGVPVIYVSESLPPALISRLAHDLGPTVWYFDEFGKRYPLSEETEHRHGVDHQSDFLSLLSSRNLNKTLFLFTENSSVKVSEFIMDRPQRIKYWINQEPNPTFIMKEMMEGKPILPEIQGWLLNQSYLLNESHSGFDIKETLIKTGIGCESISEYFDSLEFLNVPGSLNTTLNGVFDTVQGIPGLDPERLYYVRGYHVNNMSDKKKLEIEFTLNQVERYEGKPTVEQLIPSVIFKKTFDLDKLTAVMEKAAIAVFATIAETDLSIFSTKEKKVFLGVGKLYFEIDGLSFTFSSYTQMSDRLGSWVTFNRSHTNHSGTVATDDDDDGNTEVKGVHMKQPVAVQPMRGPSQFGFPLKMNFDFAASGVTADKNSVNYHEAKDAQVIIG